MGWQAHHLWHWQRRPRQRLSACLRRHPPPAQPPLHAITQRCHAHVWFSSMRHASVDYMPHTQAEHLHCTCVPMKSSRGHHESPAAPSLQATCCPWYLKRSHGPRTPSPACWLLCGLHTYWHSQGQGKACSRPVQWGPYSMHCRPLQRHTGGASNESSTIDEACWLFSAALWDSKAAQQGMGRASTITLDVVLVALLLL